MDAAAPATMIAYLLLSGVALGALRCAGGTDRGATCAVSVVVYFVLDAPSCLVVPVASDFWTGLGGGW